MELWLGSCDANIRTACCTHAQEPEQEQEVEQEEEGDGSAILVTDADTPMGEQVVLQLILARWVPQRPRADSTCPCKQTSFALPNQCSWLCIEGG